MQIAASGENMTPGKSLRNTSFFFLFLFSVFLNSEHKSYAKGKTSIVFSGGGLQTAVFLGMLAGVESEGVHPDVIVSTCGGSISAAIAQFFPTTEQRYSFLHTHDFHRMMRAPKITESLNAFKTLSILASLKTGIHRPSFADTFIMHVPFDLGFQTARQEQFKQGPLRVAMVAAQLQVNQIKMDGSGARYKEVFFTDHTSARDLQGFRSPLSDYSNMIDPETATIEGTSLVEAARASITDPYFIDMLPVNGRYYLTGGIDLYPREAAGALGEEVIMQLSGGLNESFEAPVIQDVFGYNINQRLRDVTSQSARYWVDFSDFGELLSKSGMNPKMKVSMLHAMQLGVPKDFNEFIQRVDEQWNWGFQRGKEAIQVGRNHPNYKLHIRKFTKRNSLPTLRKWVKFQKKNAYVQ
jgi:hypothetical protein